MKVMVTGAGALLGQGILRSLAESALTPDVIAVDPSELAAIVGGKLDELTERCRIRRCCWFAMVLVN